MVVKYDKEKCIGCGLCMETCPFKALILSDGIAEVRPEYCTDCGACVKVCPTSAFEVTKKREKMSKEEREMVVRQKEKAVEIHQELERYQGVWIFVEQVEGIAAPVSWELMGAGRLLAEKLETKVAAVILGHKVEHLAQEAFSYGAHMVYLMESPVLKDYRNQAYTHGVVQMASKHHPEIFLIGATSLGRDLAGSVATYLETGLTADCTELDVESESRFLLQSRPAFGGNVMATILCRHHRPQMATVRPRVLELPQPQEGRTGEVIREEFNMQEEKITARLVERIREKGKGTYLDKAEVIVAGGRGIGSKENFQKLKDLADMLGGTLGASRAAVDAGWIGVEHQIGQTGVTVRPKLYFAVGLSGAIQHLVGMQTSDVIVAVNSDPEAEIFNVATYGIVGDWQQVIPALTEQFSQKL